ncbi:hypothetical protein [Paenibacillus sp. J2TS4]|uniref:hypothetical protein n=1 Tax=Paenibacillus sp. J2TS4 TaxID=2807194 RepID=UPI001B1D3626|nr:hypothetical protein [Paenibacillus sp. J2TS4]GIP35902.1 hypothetical protein J2TS4_51120 [Paenibacillus sp. J2TS4]
MINNDLQQKTSFASAVNKHQRGEFPGGKHNGFPSANSLQAFGHHKHGWFFWGVQALNRAIAKTITEGQARRTKSE